MGKLLHKTTQAYTTLVNVQGLGWGSLSSEKVKVSLKAWVSKCQGAVPTGNRSIYLSARRLLPTRGCKSHTFTDNLAFLSSVSLQPAQFTGVQAATLFERFHLMTRCGRSGIQITLIRWRYFSSTLYALQKHITSVECRWTQFKQSTLTTDDRNWLPHILSIHPFSFNTSLLQNSGSRTQLSSGMCYIL